MNPQPEEVSKTSVDVRSLPTAIIPVKGQPDTVLTGSLIAPANDTHDTKRIGLLERRRRRHSRLMAR